MSRRFSQYEKEAMEERYIFLKKKLESPRASTPENEYVDGGKKDYSKLITEMSLIGKLLDKARRFMDKRETVEKWENIVGLFPFKISVRSLQQNYRKWGVPIRRWVFNGLRYVYVDEFRIWFKRNEEVLFSDLETDRY